MTTTMSFFLTLSPRVVEAGGAREDDPVGPITPGPGSKFEFVDDVIEDDRALSIGLDSNPALSRRQDMISFTAFVV